jgi:hypothetical protein
MSGKPANQGATTSAMPELSIVTNFTIAWLSPIRADW